MLSISFDKLKHERSAKGKSLLAFPDNYCIIDIETTGLSTDWDSIIEVAALKFRNNILVDKFSSLLKPNSSLLYLDDFIIELTGITPEMLSHAPDTLTVLKDFRTFIENDILIGHNINFDINFLYDKCDANQLETLSNDFVDTMRLSRRIHPEFSHHRLSDIANYYSVDYSRAHRAFSDVEITAKCFSFMKQEVLDQYTSFDDFKLSLQKSRHTKAADISTTATNFNSLHPLYQKVCVFTGALEKMPRKEAMQIVVDLGGKVADGVTKKTNFLILGNNDYCSSIKDGKSSKQKKAEKYKSEGCDIEIIPENVFYDLLSENISDI